VRLLVASCLLLLAGCASAPAQAPHPYFATGPLKGHLEQGLYHDQRGWYGIQSPIAPDDPGYPYMSLGEEYHDNLSYASFIPLDHPGEYYRAYVEDFPAAGHVVPDMHVVADSAMRFFGRQLVQTRVEPLDMVEERSWQAGATAGVLRLYTERTPVSALTQDTRFMGEDYTAYILVYVTQDHGKVAMLWAEWPVDCKICQPVPPGPATESQDPIDRALAADARSKPFLDSFRYGAD
jgi:hypothetical protein